MLSSHLHLKLLPLILTITSYTFLSYPLHLAQGHLLIHLAHINVPATELGAKGRKESKDK